MAAYPFKEIEPKWQSYWEDHETFRTPRTVDTSRPKFYVLDMFPYPSGAGLHVGHPEGYTATDIIARYKRMRGFNVLHPMGWDAFGLPAEQYALKTNTHPRVTTDRNVARFRQQLRSLGFSYDWSREIDTTDPSYHRWTQWIFLKLYERGLAYQSEQPVWWCPELGTTLANEEVVDGHSDIGGYPCIRKPVRQWVLRITEYAEKLLEGLDELDWPDSTKEMQRNWIGRSEGAEIDFPVTGHDASVRVFTTRPDTIFGATYMVLAPEHPLVDAITIDERRAEVSEYLDTAARKSDVERTDAAREKSGVNTGATVTNPANGAEIPVWIADYVLASYGTGAIMAVPGQDERDWAFAEVYDLPIVRTVQPPDDFDGKAYTGEGPAINSGFLDGLGVEGAKASIVAWLEDNGHGRAHVAYKLRDWLFSRQRYWGEPIPIMFVDGEALPVDEASLPVGLPELEEFKPSGTPEGPLALATDWLEFTDPDTGERMRRETNTMPQWAGSCWYFLRFIDPVNDNVLVDPELEKYWMPVDLYVGGAEHAVLHLLYARFWHKVLFDAGVVSTPEPFGKLVHQGMILGEYEYTGYREIDSGDWVTLDDVRRDMGADGTTPSWTHAQTGSAVEPVSLDESDVTKAGDGYVLADASEVRVDARAYKMSKSRGNVVNPDEIIDRYGADAFRLYEMFMGPLEQVKPWSTRSVEGPARFLNRAWRLFERGVDDAEPAPDEVLRLLHRTIRKVTDDIEALRFNTAIAALMEFVNEAQRWDELPREVADVFAKLLSPFAPHIGEELWQRLGHSTSLSTAEWPVAEERWLKSDTIKLAVQVNGRMRGTIEVPADAGEADVLAIAKSDENVARHLEGVEIRREIYVPGRIVNFVAG